MQDYKTGLKSFLTLFMFIQKSENFLNEKTVKITKQAHALKGYLSSYNVEILKSINPEQQLKDTESATERKLKELLSELRGFKLVIT